MTFLDRPYWQRRVKFLAFIGLIALFSSISLADEVVADGSGTPAVPENVVWLGLYLIDEVDGGVRVRAVVPDSPAALAGLRSGDLLVGAGSVEISQQVDLERFLAGYEPGSRLYLSGFRNGSPIKTMVIPVVASRPPSAPQPSRVARTAQTPTSPAPV
jgi:predicted metalloprotease with PDZ domain